jgi:hypothetical protein
MPLAINTDPILRHEKKYLLARRQIPALRADLAALLAPDPHSGVGGYQVRSLYFETWTLHSLREKLDGLYDRFKLRVRGYPPIGPADAFVAEIKQKRGDQILKQRTRVDATELDLLCAGRYGELLSRREDDAVLRRFVAAKASLGSVAPLIVEYTREAFQHPSRHVYLRATLDYGLSAAPHGRLASTDRGQPFGTDVAILEVKTSGTPPDWLRMLTEKHRLDLAAVSKFAYAVRRSYARVDR